jgi:hypothetical protein
MLPYVLRSPRWPVSAAATVVWGRRTKVSSSKRLSNSSMASRLRSLVLRQISDQCRLFGMRGPQTDRKLRIGRILNLDEAVCAMEPPVSVTAQCGQ